MNIVLKADKIEKKYSLRHKEIDVLKGTSLEVSKGEHVAIIGKSGAGKSTLMHILGGLDHPDRGRVMFKDIDLYSASENERAKIRARDVGFVFQSYHLLPEMDVLENVTLPAMAKSSLFGAAGSIRKRGRELLEAVGLLGRSDHTPLELSGGEQQRVALARALINDPEIVFADEPTGNLDDSTGGHVLDYLFNLLKERDHTLIMVTHNEATAQRCDRVLRLEGGMLY